MAFHVRSPLSKQRSASLFEYERHASTCGLEHKRRHFKKPGGDDNYTTISHDRTVAVYVLRHPLRSIDQCYGDDGVLRTELAVDHVR
jgi:hypothetical protein